MTIQPVSIYHKKITGPSPLPKCCLPESLGGDVSDENRDHFYEFCKEKSKLIEEKYKYLDTWSNQEASF